MHIFAWFIFNLSLMASIKLVAKNMQFQYHDQFIAWECKQQTWHCMSIRKRKEKYSYSLLSLSKLDNVLGERCVYVRGLETYATRWHH